jgi:2-amino-4-hydroxy-6-hydroxymethyldihydropteridine diphosphokinase
MQESSSWAAVALGSNLGDSHRFFLQAQAALLRLPGCTAFRFSSIYLTTPIDSEGSSDYLNAAVVFETSLPPQDLLERLSRIEQEQGRQRGDRNVPRTLDLDLLLYGDRVLQTPSLCVPHPRLHERFFALTPLVELVPRAQHPVLNVSLRKLEQRLEAAHVKETYIRRSTLSFASVAI